MTVLGTPLFQEMMIDVSIKRDEREALLVNFVFKIRPNVYIKCYQYYFIMYNIFKIKPNTNKFC
jgi:hypothetical protein